MDGQSDKTEYRTKTHLVYLDPSKYVLLAQNHGACQIAAEPGWYIQQDVLAFTV